MFQFEERETKELKEEREGEDEIKEKLQITFFPSKEESCFCLNEENNYTIGGEIFFLSTSSKYKISRLIGDSQNFSRIQIDCLDKKNGQLLRARFVESENVFRDKTTNHSARSFMTLVFTPNISEEKQQQLVLQFNDFLNEKRKQYRSLFLPSFRDNNRKRISFDLVYRIIGHLLLS